MLIELIPDELLTGDELMSDGRIAWCRWVAAADGSLWASCGMAPDHRSNAKGNLPHSNNTTYSNYLTIHQPHTNHTPTTHRPNTNHTPTTHQPPTTNAPTTHRPNTNHTPTTYQPRTNHAPTTHHSRTNHTLTTHQPHTTYAPTTHQPHTNHTPITHQPHTNHTPITHQPHTTTTTTPVCTMSQLQAGKAPAGCKPDTSMYVILNVRVNIAPVFFVI